MSFRLTDEKGAGMNQLRAGDKICLEVVETFGDNTIVIMLPGGVKYWLNTNDISKEQMRKIYLASNEE